MPTMLESPRMGMGGAPTRKVRVMLVDDERITRLYLRDLIEEDADLEVVQEADSGDVAIGMLAEIQEMPDVVLLDLGYNTDGKSGLDAGPKIRELLPDVSILVLSQHDEYYDECRSWADGYLIKDQAPENLAKVVREMVLEDKGYVSKEALDAASRTGRILSNSRLDKLSAIERRVMILTAKGMSSEAVAKTMDRSVYTINNHLVRIYNKLKIPPERRNKQELTRLATEARMITP